MKLLIITLFSLVLTGSPAEADTLKKIRESGIITLGHRDSAIPFSYLDGNQTAVGYSMDICAHVIDHIRHLPGMSDIKVKYQVVTSMNRIPLLTNGTIDLECGSNSNTIERQALVAFTPTIFVTAGKIAYRRGSGIRGIEDLRGRKLAVVIGTTNLRWIRQINAERNLGIDLIQAANHAEGFLMLESGRVDAVINDDILLAGLIANSKDPGQWEIGTRALSVEPYGLMLRKDDLAFKAEVDKAIKSLFASGRIRGIYDRWFVSPIPPRNINLQIPMSSSLRRAIANPTDTADPRAYE